MISTFIYKITNLVNGKCYIGQTVGSIEARWKRHCSDSNKCPAIHNAILKYGIQNFQVEQIDTATSQEELNEKEAHWITTLNTISPNGYNLQNGGLREQLSQESCEKISNTIRDKYRNNEINISWKRKVCQYNKQGSLIKVWDSIKDASLALDIQAKHIPDACRGKRKSVGGYMWRYYEDTLGEPISVPARKRNPDSWFNSHRKPVLQFDLDGNFIRRWDSTSQAANELNVSNGYICETCNGKHKSAKGYIWRYADTQETD